MFLIITVARRSEVSQSTSSITARVSLFGSDAEVSVPSNEERRKLTMMFAMLEATVKELKEENRALR